MTKFFEASIFLVAFDGFKEEINEMKSLPLIIEATQKNFDALCQKVEANSNSLQQNFSQLKQKLESKEEKTMMQIREELLEKETLIKLFATNETLLLNEKFETSCRKLHKDILNIRCENAMVKKVTTTHSDEVENFKNLQANVKI